MLTEIVDITVIENDNYPQNICTNCLDKLYSAYNFKQQCQETRKKFEEYLNNLDTKDNFDSIHEEKYFIVKEDIDFSNNYEEDEKEKVIKTKKKVVKKKRMCKICNQGVTKLFEHMRKHTKEKPYKCETCDKRFSFISNYRRHLRIHGGEKRFGCDICQRRFTRKHTLQTHRCLGEQRKPRTPTEYKPREAGLVTATNEEENELFLCSFCGKSFANRQGLVTHRVVHTGEKPYKCAVCEKTFAYSASLRVHETSHTDEKRFKCSFCEKQFRVRSHCLSHEKNHTGEKQYKCSFCEREFLHRSTWKSHELIHTGEKPYECQFCMQSFRQRHHLIAHLRTHTGEKPFKCQYCDKNFALKGNLTVHERIHTEKGHTSVPSVRRESPSLNKRKENHLLTENERQNEESTNQSNASLKIPKVE
ncbi:zinc finger protein 85-like [Chrysoperla carnea]|uniref:zinc finger protein 85-like n=1 Tax=Chrysoperla carnea TaxID=189513 RepID=UPI001D079F7C|nr:zinc finger protein 85-like [Chrysoperla carnea]